MQQACLSPSFSSATASSCCWKRSYAKMHTSSHPTTPRIFQPLKTKHPHLWITIMLAGNSREKWRNTAIKKAGEKTETRQRESPQLFCLFLLHLPLKKGYGHTSWWSYSSSNAGLDCRAINKFSFTESVFCADDRCNRSTTAARVTTVSSQAVTCHVFHS